MSVRIMAQIWPLPMQTTDKIVLLKLADCASDDGCNAYPTVARIAAETGVSERTVQYTLRRLEERGVLAVDRPSGRYQATSYRLVMGALVAPLRERMGATDDAMGATDDVHGCKAFAPDPSVNHQEIHQSGADAPTPLFSDLEKPEKHQPITPKFLTELQAANPDVDVQAIYERVRNLKRWDGYKDKRRALTTELGYERERRARFATPQQPKANPAGVTRIDDPNYAPNRFAAAREARQRMMQ